MKTPTYDADVEWLFHQHPAFQKIGNIAYHPTLDNTRKLIHFLKFDLNTLAFIHVAGTNGKGTTCSILSSILTEAGYKVGLFTSPHIKDFRERIRINGKMIPKKNVAEMIALLKNHPLSFSPSFFEITWVMALSYFASQKCDIVVVETGLGGRLDATNVILPKITAITNIGLDHIQILGNSLTEIAKEKAGIIKPNIPIIIGESTTETTAVFKNKAEKEAAPLQLLPPLIQATAFEKNKALALAILHLFDKDKTITKAIIQQGIHKIHQNTGWFGRFQIINQHPLTIVDAAHNLEGIKCMIHDIQQLYPNKKILALYGTSNDKNVALIMKTLPRDWQYFFTEFPNKRAMKKNELKKIAKQTQIEAQYFSNPNKAYFTAKEGIDDTSLLLLFGSFYLIENFL